MTGNRGESGGGLFFSNSPNPTIISTTIAANSARQAGGGIRSGHSAIVLERSILWGNCATSGGPAVYFDGPGELSVECCAIDSAGISSLDQVLFLGEQVFTDPLFCDAEECKDAPTSDGEWAIDANSPCVAERSPCGQLIGGRGIGCESPTATIQVSWGQMKARFGK